MICKDLQSLERARDPLRKARVEMKTGEGNSRMVKDVPKLVWLGQKRMSFSRKHRDGTGWSCVKDLVQEPLDLSRDVWRGEVA